MLKSSVEVENRRSRRYRGPRRLRGRRRPATEVLWIGGRRERLGHLPHAVLCRLARRVRSLRASVAWRDGRSGGRRASASGGGRCRAHGWARDLRRPGAREVKGEFAPPPTWPANSETPCSASTIELHSRHHAATSTTSSCAPSGVWVVDAKTYSGRVFCRDVGPARRHRKKLYVGGRDRTRTRQGPRQADRMRTRRAGLEPATNGTLVYSALCLP